MSAWSDGAAPLLRAQHQHGAAFQIGLVSGLGASASAPTTHKPPSFSSFRVLTRFVTATTGVVSAAPTATFRTVAVTWAARSRGTTTASAPHASAVRKQAPRLCGSWTPSKANTSGFFAAWRPREGRPRTTAVAARSQPSHLDVRRRPKLASERVRRCAGPGDHASVLDLQSHVREGRPADQQA